MTQAKDDPSANIITQQEESPKYKPLTIQVPNDVDTSGIEGFAFSADMAQVALTMLRSWADGQRQKEADRVPADSPLACSRCKQQRANHCSLCQKQNAALQRRIDDLESRLDGT